MASSPITYDFQHCIRVNGDRYEGEWRNGRMHGKGVKVMANGDVYNGTWENDKAEGNGVKVSNAHWSSLVGAWQSRSRE